MTSNSNNINVSKATYKIIKLLGKGSYGQAYLAKNNLTKTDCVIKQINLEKMSEKEKNDILNESVILKKLDHPNIIKFYEVFISKKPQHVLNIVTEYADDGDLSQKIKQNKNKYFEESYILDIFTQICLALKHIHDKKIIHRDLKSQNIFLTKSGLVKLGDFGIAKNLDYTWDKARTLIGTPYYLSPEMVTNKPYSYKSDIWSLGVLLYEMCNLKMPFDAPNLPMLSLKIMRGNYNPLNGNFSKDLKNLVASMLLVNVDKRPSINEILRCPLIKNRIKNFLNEVDYNREFSKSIVKYYKKEKKEVKKENKENKKDNNSSKNISNVQTVANTNENNDTLNSHSNNNKNLNKENPHLKFKINNNNENKNTKKENKSENKKESNKNVVSHSPQNNNNNNNINSNKKISFKDNVNNNNSKIKINQKHSEGEILKKPSENNKKNIKQKFIIKPSTSSSNKHPTIKDEKSKENNKNNNNSQEKKLENKTNPRDELRNFLKKKREEMKRENNNNNNIEIRAVKSFKENSDVIWGNKKKRENFPINNHFPEVIFVDKKINEVNEEEKYFKESFNSTNPIDNFLKSYIKENNENFNYKNMNEDQYNQNRLLNNLANIVNNDKEDSDNENEDNQNENMNSDAVNVFDDNIANLISNEKDSNNNVNQDNNNKNNINENKNKENLYESDFGEIEELRIDLENSLGINLFKEIYHYVDENTDENEVKCDYEKLNLKLNTELKNKNFNEKEIETAIKKIPEVFTIVGKERICNKNN